MIRVEIAARAALAFSLMYGAALALYPSGLRRLGPLKIPAALVLGAVVLGAALLLPPEPRWVVAGLAIVGLLWVVRIYSFWREEPRRGFGDYLRFLSVALLSPHLVYSDAGVAREQPLRVGRELLRLLWGGAGMAAGMTAALHLLRPDGWLWNHAILVVGFGVFMQSLGQVLYGIWTLLGFRSRPLADGILFSRTPAEFWRRWSPPIHLWFYRYIYVPIGGKRRRAAAVLAVFLINGLLHELLFGIALRRITGHQMIFFALSAVGVLISPALARLERLGWGGVLVMHLVTIAYLGATGLLMFASTYFVHPIARPPEWLIW
jgi:hypothetical protein